MTVDELTSLKELLDGALSDLRVVWESLEMTSDECIHSLEAAIEKVYHAKLDLE